MRVLVAGLGLPPDQTLVRFAGGRLPPGDVAITVTDLPAETEEALRMVEGADPQLLLLVGPFRRGGPPGEVRRRRVAAPLLPEPAGPAGGAMGRLLDVAGSRGALPYRTLVIEVEPDAAGKPGPEALERALELVRREILLLPLWELADRLRRIVPDLRTRRGDQQALSPAFHALRDLLGELAVAEHEGGWGRTFALRDRLREHLVAGDAGAEIDRMDHLEWSMVWALVEELDRLQGIEGSPGDRT